MSRRFIQSIIVVALLSGAFSLSVQAQDRIALVIGNARYENADALANPTRDAEAMGAVLQQVGFNIDVQTNLDQRGMQEALRDFGLRAETAEVALVYYAGHGIQVASENYLLPVDARLERERDLIYEALPLNVVVSEVAQAERLGMVILDACRDNPLAENLRQALGPSRSSAVGQGLARVEDLPSNTLIAFSTRFDQVASDGDGELSPYTAALVDQIRQPGLELDMMFRKVRDTVLAETADRQEPRTVDALGAEPFYFVAQPTNQSPQLPSIQAVQVPADTPDVPLNVGVPTDPDNDELSVVVMDLPLAGTVKADGQPVRFGDQLSIEQLQSLNFDSTGGNIGDAGSFVFVVRDGKGGIATGSVPIEVVDANQTPSVATALQLPPIPLGIQKPVDPEGDELVITVTSVFDLGTIRNGQRVVQVGDVLTPDDLAGLVLDASGGASGDFSYEISDGQTTTRSGFSLGGPASSKQFAALQPPTEPEVRAPDRTLGTAPTAAPAEAESQLFEVTTSANVRAEPSANAARIDIVGAGAQLKVIERVDDRNWYQVELPNGSTGYIYADLLRPLPQSPAGVGEKQTQVAALGDAPTAPLTALQTFKDCDDCPEMVVLPPGSFTMGSSNGDRSEQPVHEVSISKPFAIGKYEVTQAEWQACVASGGCGTLSGTFDPTAAVRNISWPEAKAYADWLTWTTGKPYRLPSEAEWEYAARAGASTPYWWGDIVGDSRADCADCGGNWNRRQPAPIGSFDANEFGLYDVLGGVSEWVADCWSRDHSGAPGDGSVRDQPDCRQRVLRGGSWRNEAKAISVASRLGYDANVRYYTNGLRLARDVD